NVIERFQRDQHAILAVTGNTIPVHGSATGVFLDSHLAWSQCPQPGRFVLATVNIVEMVDGSFAPIGIPFTISSVMSGSVGLQRIANRFAVGDCLLVWCQRKRGLDGGVVIAA